MFFNITQQNSSEKFGVYYQRHTLTSELQFEGFILKQVWKE